LLIPIAAVLFSALWLLCATAAFVTERTYSPRKVVVWALTPLIAIVAFPFVVSGLPLRVRLELSRGSLDSVARDVAAGRREPPEDGRLGLYNIYMAHRTQGSGFAFLIEDTGFIDPCGLAFSEHAEPIPDGAQVVWHVSGPWYGWCWDF
jgi:hypothetical protein